MNTFKSDISGKEFPLSDRISGKSIRPSIIELIRKDKDDFGLDSFLSISELNLYRNKYVELALNNRMGKLTSQEKKVLDTLKNKATLTDKLDGEDNNKGTLGQRVADKVASFGGSWTFIISFGVFLFVWIGINIFWLNNKAFDPYPFILLNLILSSLAALQAPVIMMSQNRQEEKDRERAKNDYMINLKSEIEIRMLHEKLDHLILNQQQEILDIQNTQMEKITEILNVINKEK